MPWTRSQKWLYDQLKRHAAEHRALAKKCAETYSGGPMHDACEVLANAHETAAEAFEYDMRDLELLLDVGEPVPGEPCGVNPCECNMPRCPVCNYTEHDARQQMDHHLCSGKIPLGTRTKEVKR